MPHIGNLDLPDRLAPGVPRIVTQCVIGILGAAGAIALRAVFEEIGAGESAPYAFCFPAMMLTTLFARWQAGAVTGILGIGYAWHRTVPIAFARLLTHPSGGITLALVVMAATLTVTMAELFRRAARRATEERDGEIAHRDLLLREIDHRMKNNFAIIASILDIQRRRSEGDAATALGVALARVESIARAHRHLYRHAGEPDAVPMRDYLGDLCLALGNALLLRGGIELACSSDDVLVPRDRAVSIGLVVNELVTNAAKHAFGGRAGGTITVGFRARPGGWTLIVSDDGVGMPALSAPASPDNGLGSRLIPAFAHQANGTLSTESGPEGTTVTMDLPATA